jgi:hypothetical protein
LKSQKREDNGPLPYKTEMASRLNLQLLLSLVITLSATLVASDASSVTGSGCALLAQRYPNQTFFPGSSEYVNDTAGKIRLSTKLVSAAHYSTNVYQLLGRRRAFSNQLAFSSQHRRQMFPLLFSCSRLRRPNLPSGAAATWLSQGRMELPTES